MMSVAIVTQSAPRFEIQRMCRAIPSIRTRYASYAHKGQGYMAHLVETYCEDDSNEAVAASSASSPTWNHKMTVHDGIALPDALDD